MLETIIVILVVLWLIGAFAFSLGWFVHLLLVLAVIVLLFRIIRGRPTTTV